MQLIYVHWFYILPLCIIPIWVLAILEWSLLGFPHKVACYLQRERLWLLWQFEWLFISFYYLIPEARTSSTMLNNSDESGHPYCVLDLSRKALSFSPLRMIFTVSFLYMAFRYWSMFPLSLLCEEFNQERCYTLSNTYASIERILWFFSFFDVVYHIDWFEDIEPQLQPRNKSHLVVVNNPSNVLLDPLDSMLVRICASLFIGDIGL